MTLPVPAVPPWQQWDLHPSVVIGLAVLGGVYIYWGGLKAPRRRVVSFAAALTVLGLALNGPLHNLSDTYLFSAHMVQHLVLTLVVPPLLIGGTPGWMLRPLLGPPALRRAATWATRPGTCFVIFNVVLAAWHLPPLYNLALAHHPVHIVQHLLFIAA